MPTTTKDRRAISEAEASEYLGVSRATLRQGRCDGRRDNRMPPPPYCKIGRKIVYLVDDLDTWLMAHRIEF
jgi:predicted DNA-binding transcriptional regulator AlpA